MLYHGSKITGMKTLKRFPHQLLGGSEVVFATPDIRFALAMIQGTGKELGVGYFVNKDTGEEQMYLEELSPHAFDLLKTSGTLYTVDENGFVSDSRISHIERISPTEVSVVSEQHIPNIFDELQKYNITFLPYQEN